MTGNVHSQIDRFQTIQRLPLFFQNNSKDFFSFLKFKDFSRLVLNSRLVQEPCKDEGGGGDNWSFKTCKTPVKSSSSTTNQTPSFIQAWCPSCHPTNSVIVSANLSLLTYLLTYCDNTEERKYHILRSYSPELTRFWPIKALGYLGRVLPSLSPSIWRQYPMASSQAFGDS